MYSEAYSVALGVALCVALACILLKIGNYIMCVGFINKTFITWVLKTKPTI